MTPQSLPYSEESERAVLGGVLLDPEALPQLARRLLASDFYQERHVLVFSAMLDLQEHGATVDLRTLQAKLEQRGQLAAIGGLSYLAALDLDLPDIGRIDQYAEIVKERATRRHLIQASSETIRDCMDGGLPAEEAVALARQRVLAIEREAAGVKETSVEVAAVMAGVKGRLAETTDKGIDISTGFPVLDALTCGLPRRMLSVVAGRPSMGKTALALQIAARNAKRGKVVFFRSIESSREELGLRFLAQESGIHFMKLRQPWRLEPQERRNAERSADYLASLPLIIEDSSDRTDYRALSAWARAEASRRGRVDLLIGDYLQLAASTDNGDNMRLRIDATVNAWKALAKELDCHAMWLSQLSRPQGERRDYRPRLWELKESGGIEAAADVVLFPHREHYYDKNASAEEAEIGVAKQRDGPAGPDVVARLGWEGECVRFR